MILSNLKTTCKLISIAVNELDRKSKDHLIYLIVQTLNNESIANPTKESFIIIFSYLKPIFNSINERNYIKLGRTNEKKQITSILKDT